MSVKKIRFLLFFSFFISHFSIVSALDFGVLLNQGAGYGGMGSDGKFDYSISIVPRISGLIGKAGDFIISGSFEADYNGAWSYTPELLTTEFSFHPGGGAIEIGRMYHCDPLGFVAEGLFDGVKLAYSGEAGTFSAGAWYTGLLYKKRAIIAMTAEELEAISAPFKFSDFMGTYFAPKRFMGALGWEHLGWALRTRISLLGQFDFFGDKPLNSQYAIIKFTVPAKAVSLSLGGCFELMEGVGDLKTAFAAEAGIAIAPPRNRISLLARYSSGANGQMAAFLPFTTESQGNILGVKLSGLALAELDYLASIHRTFSLNVNTSYFMRTDTVTFSGYPLSTGSGGGKFLGSEFFGQFIWNPVSDLAINLGGGIFMPSLGDAAPKADNKWRVELNVVLSF